ncbi:MAG: hypothetical protein A3K19_24055 [Lentisphaerae bacterium RIFOXYB12_FULL_65_16]|nr:MAG: hypothetical protein A3K18_02190 [Lentisphaerae bacterium RIFOXYA12_64_32]OGV89179.1 MAG: hypothetical protein A3K19_24055 [Lentisphaerae bacterium RIFOXYB12_FULL_65_16]
MKRSYLSVFCMALSFLVFGSSWAAEFAATKSRPAALPAGVEYQVKDKVVEIELSEYAGYAGLIAANGGLEPTEDSVFFKKHGFKLKIALSEEESWPQLNQGKMAASATTVDVLPVYGRDFFVTVPALIGYSRGADGLVVRSDVRKVNALKGKTLVTAQFTEADFFIRYLAFEAGLPINMLADVKAAPVADKLNLVFCDDGFSAGDLLLDDVKSGRNRLAGCVTWAPKTTEVVQASDGKCAILATSRNVLIVADVLIVNRGFAQKNPAMVLGLADGLLEGNRMVRRDPKTHLGVVAKAFGWDAAKAEAEMAKVHLANLAENLAFFSGSITSAGSFGGIYQAAVLSYGELLRNPPDSDFFQDTQHLKALEKLGGSAGEQVSIAPIRTEPGATGGVEKDPLLSKDIRFLFEPNSAVLDLRDPENLQRLDSIKRLLQVSPGSLVFLRGHVDDTKVATFRKQGGEQLVRRMALEAMELSKNRALEIKRLLVDRCGVAAERLDATGRGWEEPTGKDGAQNRRVEVQWFTVE